MQPSTSSNDSNPSATSIQFVGNANPSAGGSSGKDWASQEPIRDIAVALPVGDFPHKENSSSLKRAYSRTGLFNNRTDCVQFAWWLRTLLPPDNPLEKDDEFYAFVTYLIKFSFCYQSSPFYRINLDHLLHAGTLVAKYLELRPSRLQKVNVAHAFKHFVALSVELNEELSIQDKLSDNPCFLATSDVPFSIHARDYYFAAINYNPNYSGYDPAHNTFKYDLLPQAWCSQPAPAAFSLARASSVMAAKRRFSFEKSLEPKEDEDYRLFKRITSTPRYTCLWRHANKCLMVLSLGAIASIAAGVVLSLTWPALVGMLSFAVFLSIGVWLMSKEVNNALSPPLLFNRSHLPGDEVLKAVP